eukprot:65172_1
MELKKHYPICGHFSWPESHPIPFIEACINSTVPEVLGSQYPLPNPYTLCSKCSLDVLIQTNYLQQFFDYFQPNNSKSIMLVTDYTTIIEVLFLRMPTVRRYFCSYHAIDKYEKFMYLFNNLLRIYNFWKEFKKNGETPCEETEYSMACIVFEFVTAKNIKCILDNNSCPFLNLLSYKQNIFKVCKYIERFKYKVKRIKYSDDWKLELRNSYLKIGSLCPISSHILIILYKYARKHGINNLKDYITETNFKFILLQNAFKRMDSVKDAVEELYLMHKYIVKSEYVKNISNIRCSNEKCNKQYLKYGATYQELYESKYDTDYKHYATKKPWKKCKGCCMVYYCSRKCQKYDWNRFNHKTICKKLTRF